MKSNTDFILGCPGSMPASLRFSSLTQGPTHLCDHLLTPPEMHAWSWIFPPIREAADNDRLRFRLGKSLWKNMITEGKDLLSLWIRELEESMARARRLGWLFKDGGRILFFDPNGVLLVAKPAGILVSAYIPLPTVPVLPFPVPGRHWDGDRLLDSRRKNPFPREGSWKVKEKDVKGHLKIELRRHQVLRPQWGGESWKSAWAVEKLPSERREQPWPQNSIWRQG